MTLDIGSRDSKEIPDSVYFRYNFKISQRKLKEKYFQGNYMHPLQCYRVHFVITNIKVKMNTIHWNFRVMMGGMHATKIKSNPEC
jgi:hypothetical protein